jgi:hypothetical protein
MTVGDESQDDPFPALQNAPTQRTDPLDRFVTASQETVGFVLFTTEMAARIDEMQRIAREALEKLDSSRDTEAERPGVTERLRRFRLVVLEMLLTRGVDNYLTYLAELLAVVFRTRPEMLRSAETIRLDFALRHSTMDELIESLTERRVERLAYLGMRDLADDLRTAAGFDLFSDESSLARAMRVVETRNLIVHNRGVVNRRYASRSRDAPEAIGERIQLSFDAVMSDLAFLSDAAYSTDSGAIAKWGIPAATVESTDEVTGSDEA